MKYMSGFGKACLIMLIFFPPWKTTYILPAQCSEAKADAAQSDGLYCNPIDSWMGHVISLLSLSRVQI